MTPPISFAQIRQEALAFTRDLLAAAKAQGFMLDPYELDHLCYRTASEAVYEAVCRIVAAEADKLVESPVGGRLISTFRLRHPWEHLDRKIAILEIPAPKKGVPYPTGFEHAEFVIDESFESFMKRHPRVVFDMSGARKSVNPELRVQLAADKSLKFHHRPLEDVIRQELADLHQS